MNTNFLTNSNAKIKKTAKINSVRLYEFNLPAVETCPFAKDCVSICYADKGSFKYKVVKDKYEANLQATKKDNFIGLILSELDRKRPDFIRIHSSGDFYNVKYLDKWLQIAKKRPEIVFYGYTKSVPLFKALKNIPENFRFCYSLGGKKDNLIDLEKDYHAKIFQGLNELEGENYLNSSVNDLAWINANERKIGLIYH